MKINYFWKKDLSMEELNITLHPENSHVTRKIEQAFQTDSNLLMTDPKNNRKRHVQSCLIESIETFAHLSKVTLINGETYHLQKTLKELVHLENQQFYRINNSTILNFQEVASFTSGSHARLEVVTKQQHLFVVSRHYAKKIKEYLL